MYCHFLVYFLFCQDVLADIINERGFDLSFTKLCLIWKG
jgi:hypothetical protein